MARGTPPRAASCGFVALPNARCRDRRQIERENPDCADGRIADPGDVVGGAAETAEGFRGRPDRRRKPTQRTASKGGSLARRLNILEVPAVQRLGRVPKGQSRGSAGGWWAQQDSNW